jgi:hypothetical protein
MLRRFYWLLFFPCVLTGQVTAQRVGISENNAVPDVNAILDIKSSTKGVLFPRTSTSSRLAIPATKGMLVYDTTIGSYCYNTGSGWLILEGSSSPTASNIIGYWQGVVTNIMTVVHHPNGTGRLYLFLPAMTSLDTTSANVAKFDGSWQLNGDLYTSTFGDSQTGAYNFTAIIRSPAVHISGMVEAVAPNSTIGLTFYMLKR